MIKAIGGAVLLFLACILFSITVSGCKNGAKVEVCYVHPVYGQVCVAYDGRKYYDPKLTAAQVQEVERWIGTQDTR